MLRDRAVKGHLFPGHRKEGDWCQGGGRRGKNCVCSCPGKKGWGRCFRTRGSERRGETQRAGGGLSPTPSHVHLPRAPLCFLPAQVLG